MYELSDRFKKKMNRLFREQVGIMKIPHPEVDNLYERARSAIVRAYFVAKNRCLKKSSRR